jgi:hypothetical protein
MRGLGFTLAAGVAVGIVACSHVAAVHQPVDYVATNSPIEVWVIRRHNDSVFRMAQPRLQGDTLVGFVTPKDAPANLTQYAEIPVGDVRQMRARQGAPVRTGLLIAGITGGFIVAYEELVGVGGAKGQGIPPGQDGCFCDFDDICC